MSKDGIKFLYESFAVLLEYPTAKTFHHLEICLDSLRRISPDGASSLEIFHQGLEKNSLETMQEIYTVTFDMQPFCYPYVGYCLFGESYKRGAFMAQLNEAYRNVGFSASQELPDHLPVVLRFVGLEIVKTEDEFCKALMIEGVLPALEKLLKAFVPQSNNPYFGVLSALHQCMVVQHQKELNYA